MTTGISSNETVDGKISPTLRTVLAPLLEVMDEYGLPEGLESLPRFIEDVLRRTEFGTDYDSSVVADLQHIDRNDVIPIVRSLVARRLVEEGKPQDFVRNASNVFAGSIGELFAVYSACGMVRCSGKLNDEAAVGHESHAP